MRKITLLLIIGILQNLIVKSQTEIEHQIQDKIKEAIDLVSQQTIENPKDIILVRKYNSDKFYLITNFNESTLITNEVIPPEIDNVQTEVIEIEKDSISDVIWIKKKKFQSLRMTDSKNPFNKINSRFPSKTFERLQPELDALTKQAYLTKLKAKYEDLQVIQVGDLHQTYFQLTKDIDLISTSIYYPQKAREYGTQGIVELGYILNKDYTISDLKVFRDLKDGCTESVIESIKELNRRMKEKGYENKQNSYIEVSVIFKLN